MLNAMTIDVEDYYHVSAFEGVVSRRQWDQFPSRVVPNTRRLLAMLARHGVRATFLVLGWVAERFPSLVKEIAAAGHEIGCHSYWHRLIYQQSPQEFRDDLRQAKSVLEDCIGRTVTAYRAPSYSVTRASLWALEILQEEGFLYDSSIHPIWHDRYGIPDAERLPHLIGKLWEFPPSVLRLGKMNVPISGGGYFRLYPAALTVAALGWVNRHHRCPFMFYVHPWELDPAQPRIAAPWRTRWRHYLNLSTTARKLDWLLGQFRFGTLTEALEQYTYQPRNH